MLKCVIVAEVGFGLSFLSGSAVMDMCGDACIELFLFNFLCRLFCETKKEELDLE